MGQSTSKKANVNALTCPTRVAMRLGEPPRRVPLPQALKAAYYSAMDLPESEPSAGGCP